MINLIIQMVIDIIVRAIPLLLILMIIKKIFKLNSFHLLLILDISLLIPTIYLLLMHVKVNIITH